MALNRLVYDDIPHVPKRGLKRTPGPHPYKASSRHQYWFIDGRRMDFALDGITWWSLVILEGYSRTILAGAIVPTEATWVALMVLYTACLRYGVPDTLVSDSGGAYTSNDFEAVCARLRIPHETIESTKGECHLTHKSATWAKICVKNAKWRIWVSRRYRRKIYCQRFRKALFTVICLIPSPHRWG
jgi:transposase InsO family protein